MHWWLFLPIALIAGGFAYAMTHRGTVAGATLGGRRLEVHAPIDPQRAFVRIASLAAGKIRVDDADPVMRIVVLSSAPGPFSWGFVYPVFVLAEGTGSRIEIGIQSKLFQAGPQVAAAHAQCARVIEAVLAV